MEPLDPEIPVAKARRSTIDPVLAVINCPLCGRKHVHGWEDGVRYVHRVAHCLDGDPNGRGYYLDLGEANEAG